MRLEPSHRPLVGVSGAALATIPVVALLVLLPLFHPAAPTAPSTQVHAPATVKTDTTVTSNPAVTTRPATTTPASATPAVTPRQETNERVLYSIRWVGGGTRKKMSGNIPKCPPELSGDALVRVDVVVASSGVVRSAKVLTPHHPRCDEVSLREVKLWKFEPLPVKRKSPDQRCTVTFSFFKK
jgi:TonB family protein